MRKIGELSPYGQRVALTLSTIVIGNACYAAGYAISSDYESDKPLPTPREVVRTYPDEVFTIAGKLCVNGTVYGVVNNQIEALPNEGCSQTTVLNNPGITVNNH